MGILKKVENLILGPPTHATVLYREGQPIGIAGVVRRRSAEDQRSGYNDQVYNALARGDNSYRGASYAGTVLISELTDEQLQYLPR